MEPFLKISDDESKPLSSLSEKETNELLDNLLEKRELAVRSSNNIVILQQIDNFIAQVYQRIHFFDVGFITDPNANKKLIKKVHVRDDEDD